MKQNIHLKKMKGHIFGVIFINMFPAVFVSSGTNHIAVMINMKCRVWNSIHHPGLLGVNIPGLSMVVLDDLFYVYMEQTWSLNQSSVEEKLSLYVALLLRKVVISGDYNV